jgi:hypothetical protein
LIGGCSNDPVDEYYENDKKFYDIRAYFDNQINKLKVRRQNVRKQITKNGRSHVLEMNTLNWVEELEAFKESDINKPAWRDAYLTDTIFLEGSQVISHKAVNAENPIQTLVVTIHSETGDCLRVSIDKRTENFLYSSEQKLFYSAGEGYEISGNLSVKYLFNSEYEVEAEFIDG